VTSKIEDWMRHYVVSSGFARKYPYYAAVLARLTPVESPWVDVMAVEARGARVYLHVNVSFFIANLQYLWGVLLHEVHHVVLGHLTNPALRQAEDWAAMELAMEIGANEYIRDPLPGQPPVWQRYQHLGLAAGQSTRERYRLLADARAAGRSHRPPAPIDDHIAGGVGRGPSREPGPGRAAHRRLARLVREAVEEAGREPAGRLGGLLAGRAPGSLLEHIEETPGPARPACIDWKKALRAFVGRHVRRESRYTYDRPNRRFPALAGIVPGRVRRPPRDEQPRLLVAVDTSGSMTPQDLAVVARELQALGDLARFVVVECDAAIQRVYPFEGRIGSFAGRGGTDLRPPFERAFVEAHTPVGGMVYFTDGLGPYPEEPPPFPTLWVLTDAGITFPCPWGRQASLRTR
jgi:predicted metal-dependent peptidase